MEDCVSKCVSKEILERIVVRSLQTDEEKEAFLNRWNLNNLQPSTRRMRTKGLTVTVGSKLVEGTVRWQLAQYISSVVYADSFTLFLADKAQANLRMYSGVSE